MTAPTEAPTDLRRLRDDAADASQKAAATAALADAAEIADYEHRAERLRAWDERLLADFDQEHAALRAAVDDALGQVDRAVAEGGDVIAAWLAYRVAHRRLAGRTNEANATASRLGRPQPGRRLLGVREDLVEVIRAAVAREVTRRIAAEMDERSAARETYAAFTVD